MLILGLVPLAIALYLGYTLLMMQKVKSPIYSGPKDTRMAFLSYAVLLVSVTFLLFFVFRKASDELMFSVALCLTALIGVLLTRVRIGENGVFMKLRFHPWTDFRHYRWQKLLRKGIWELYLYNDVNFELTHIPIPENRVSRLDLILQNKSGLQYLDRGTKQD